jgi:hypothetical protein
VAFNYWRSNIHHVRFSRYTCFVFGSNIFTYAVIDTAPVSSGARVCLLSGGCGLVFIVVFIF